MAEIPYKIYLSENEIPHAWHNVRAVMKDKPEPFLNPQTFNPSTRDELCNVFCEELVDQELNVTDEYIEIPEEIRAFYKMYRPAPIVRAYNLEKLLDTPAHIYYKFEGNNTSGSHHLTAPRHRYITQKNKVLQALQRKQVQDSGVQLSPWLVLTTVLTLQFTW